MDKKDYMVSGLANFLHSFPHVDLTFQGVNSTFNLANKKYKESLLFWAGVPVVWMLVTLLIIVMYFCYRCCQREVEKSTPCIKWAIGILAILSCSAVGAGFYGNEEANKGMQHFIEAANDVQETIHITESQLQYLEDNINHTFIVGFGELKTIVAEAPVTPPTLLLLDNDNDTAQEDQDTDHDDSLRR